MGFDVWGINAKNQQGEYFRRNVWFWKPLWVYVYEITDGILTEEQKDLGFYNSGVKITESQCREMVKRLEEEIESGNTKGYENDYKEHVKSTGKPCDACGGTDTKQDYLLSGECCEICFGTGFKKDHYTMGEDCYDDKGEMYIKFLRVCPFSEESVKEFVEFLKNCGGFSIW